MLNLLRIRIKTLSPAPSVTETYIDARNLPALMKSAEKHHALITILENQVFEMGDIRVLQKFIRENTVTPHEHSAPKYPKARAYDWYNLVPRVVAVSQYAWEHARQAHQMREIGMTFAEIGKRMNLSTSRAMQLCRSFDRRSGDNQLSPVERFLRTPTRVDVLRRMHGKNPEEFI